MEKLAGRNDRVKKLTDHIGFEFFRKPLELFFPMGKDYFRGGCPLDKQLDEDEIIAHKRKMIDASFVEAPHHRNTGEENKQLKEVEISADWNDNPNKLRQKDTDAKWTKKSDTTYFGYKNHVKAGSACRSDEIEKALCLKRYNPRYMKRGIVIARSRKGNCRKPVRSQRRGFGQNKSSDLWIIR